MTYPPDPNNPQDPQDPNTGYYQQPAPPPEYQQPDPSMQYPPAAGYQAPPPAGGGRNFFASLFDFSFRNFVTPQVIQVYYVVALVLLGIGVLFGLIAAIVTIASDYPVLGLLQLLLVPIVGFVYLLAVRMGLELVANFFRIGDDVRAMREKADRTL